jgi:predicted dehydrogenase
MLRRFKNGERGMTVKIGIIGCGTITPRAFLPGFAPPGSPEARRAHPYYNHGVCENAEVLALADVDFAQAESLAVEFHVPHVYSEWRKLLANDEMRWYASIPRTTFMRG